MKNISLNSFTFSRKLSTLSVSWLLAISNRMPQRNLDSRQFGQSPSEVIFGRTLAKRMKCCGLSNTETRSDTVKKYVVTSIRSLSGFRLYKENKLAEIEALSLNYFISFHIYATYFEKLMHRLNDYELSLPILRLK